MTQTPVVRDGRQLVETAARTLLDPLGRELAGAVQWWELEGLPDRWPVAVCGQGPPLLLLHGFDSSFLEFRRLVPLLAAHHRLIIPDLYGFGFTPRPAQGTYNPAGVLSHLGALLKRLGRSSGPEEALGVIGASMGGSVAMELARLHPARVARLLLLAPAGLTGRGSGSWGDRGCGEDSAARPSPILTPPWEPPNWRSPPCIWAARAGAWPWHALPAPVGLPVAAIPYRSSPFRCCGDGRTESCGHPRNEPPRRCWVSGCGS